MDDQHTIPQPATGGQDVVGPGMIPFGPPDMKKNIRVELPPFPGTGQTEGPVISIEALFSDEETKVDVKVEGNRPVSPEGYHAVIDVIKHLT